ncbi:MAG: L,D-transpeptidase family protein [Ignavibacteriales bacterium]|nr:MAG: L,D-transpeptidase family protein [Ignavibacteriales bacterium]
MLKRICLQLFFLAIVFFSACKDGSDEEVATLDKKYNFDLQSYTLSIKDDFLNGTFSAFLSDSTIEYFDTLKQFYSTRQFKPIFISSFDDQDKVYAVLNILSKSDEHGLDSSMYHYLKIQNELLAALKDSIDNKIRYSHLSNAEILTADAVLKYAYHLRYGVVNPKELYPDSYFLPVPDSSKRNLFEPLVQEDVIDYLEKIQPADERYKKLQQALEEYSQKYKDIEWKLIPVPTKKIEPGYKDQIIAEIASRLITVGILDTSKSKVQDFTLFDSVIVDAIKEFQRQNGLADDGVIGKATIDRLNVSPEENIATIKINLERFRWLNYTDTAQYIVVNIPDFKLYVIENKKEKFAIKVCTGKKRPANYDERYKQYVKSKNWKMKPDDWETPMMYSQISYLILNPTWTVPPSIIREEIFAGVKKDSSYLSKKNFKVYQDGVEIDLTNVSINHLYTDKIPYRIVQDPGAGNALGRIKFMFENPFGIYLHDTPTRVPFSYSNRAVSHGCVRVEKPFLLSEYLLKGHSKWNNDYLKIETGQKITDKKIISEFYKKRAALRKNSSFGETTELKLEKKIPLFVDYYTAWVDEQGILNFRDDVYKKDVLLIERLGLKQKS